MTRRITWALFLVLQFLVFAPPALALDGLAPHHFEGKATVSFEPGYWRGRVRVIVHSSLNADGTPFQDTIRSNQKLHVGVPLDATEIIVSAYRISSDGKKITAQVENRVVPVNHGCEINLRELLQADLPKCRTYSGRFLGLIPMNHKVHAKDGCDCPDRPSWTDQMMAQDAFARHQQDQDDKRQRKQWAAEDRQREARYQEESKRIQAENAQQEANHIARQAEQFRQNEAARVQLAADLDRAREAQRANVQAEDRVREAERARREQAEDAERKRQYAEEERQQQVRWAETERSQQEEVARREREWRQPVAAVPAFTPAISFSTSAPAESAPTPPPQEPAPPAVVSATAVTPYHGSRLVQQGPVPPPTADDSDREVTHAANPLPPIEARAHAVSTPVASKAPEVRNIVPVNDPTKATWFRATNWVDSRPVQAYQKAVSSKAAQALYRLAPVTGDAIDIKEALTGKDAFTGETLTVHQRALTAVAAALPVVSGSGVRKAGEEGLERAGSVLKSLQAQRVARAVPTRVHGNSLDSPRPTTLYQLRERATDEHLKYGITSRDPPEGRYTKSFMTDKVMNVIDRGSRRDMHTQEAALIRSTPRGFLQKNNH